MLASLLLARSLEAQIPGQRRGLFLIVGYALTTAGSVLLLVSALGVKSAMLPSWAIYLGRISFGLYVYHAFALCMLRHVNPETLHLIAVRPYPLRALATLLVTIGLPFLVTLAMAHVSYRYLESPILRMKRRYEVIKSEPVLAAT
jgi:peptidoglycan/LPS O-acetylase OafA/YrhL